MQLKTDKMKTQIINEKSNPLFNRKEIVLEIESEITPSYSEAEKIVSEKFKTNPESLKIKKVHGKFGSKFFVIDANIYSSKEDKEGIEAKPKKDKKAEAKKD